MNSPSRHWHRSLLKPRRCPSLDRIAVETIGLTMISTMRQGIVSKSPEPFSLKMNVKSESFPENHAKNNNSNRTGSAGSPYAKAEGLRSAGSPPFPEDEEFQTIPRSNKMSRFPSFSENDSTFRSNLIFSESLLHKTYSEKNEKRLGSAGLPCTLVPYFSRGRRSSRARFLVQLFGFWNFKFVSDFDIRISDLTQRKALAIIGVL